MYWPPALGRHARLKIAADRCRHLNRWVESGAPSPVRFFTPEVCVAEARTVLAKLATTQWQKNPRKKSNSQAIHNKKYKTLIRRFRSDLHGGRRIESIPLQRYHVLGIHLVMPIDHRIRIPKPDKKADTTHVMGGIDQLICGTAIWLNRQIGNDSVAILSSDYRLVRAMQIARGYSRERAEKAGVLAMAEEIGIEWSNTIYPRAFNLGKCSEDDLRLILGSWPPPHRRPSRRERAANRPLTRRDERVLIDRYVAIGVSRDRLPYSSSMTRLVLDFNAETGHRYSEQDAWRELLRLGKTGRLGKARTAGPDS